MKISNTKGNSAVFLMVLSSIAVLWMTTGVQKAIQYRNAKKKSELSQQATGRSLSGAYFFREYFRISGASTAPNLFPIPYPTDLNSSPQVQAVGTLPAGVTLLPVNDPNCPSCFEFRFPKASEISQETFDSLFADPQSSLSGSGITTIPVRVRFLSFTTEPPVPPATLSPSPNLAKSLVAEVTTEYVSPGSSVTSNVVNKMEFRIDSPPTPSCNLSTTQVGNPSPGTAVTFNLKSRSIIGSAKIRSAGGAWTDIPMPANQNINTIDLTKAATTIGDFTFNAPSTSSWKIEARVTSVDPAVAEQSCELNLVVDNLFCDPLVANPVQIGTGDPSQVTLTCHGAITSMKLGDKGSEATVTGTDTADGKTYTGSFTLTAAQASRTLAGFAIGPSGTSNKPEITIAKYPQCPFVSNPNYQKTLVDPGTGRSYTFQTNYIERPDTLGTAYGPMSNGALWSTIAGPWYQVWPWPATAVRAQEMYITSTWLAISPIIGEVYCNPNNVCLNGESVYSIRLYNAAGGMVFPSEVHTSWWGMPVSPYATRFLAVAQWGPKTSPNCTLQQVNFRGYGCFREGTLILNADKQYVPIETLRRNDWVWNPLRNKAQRIKKVVRGPEKIPLIRLSTTLGDLDVTTKHPFFTPNGIVTAQEIYDRGIENIQLGGAELEGLSSISILPTENVWNIELEGSQDPKDHAVMANGLLTGDLYLQSLFKKKR